MDVFIVIGISYSIVLFIAYWVEKYATKFLLARARAARQSAEAGTGLEDRAEDYECKVSAEKD